MSIIWQQIHRGLSASLQSLFSAQPCGKLRIGAAAWIGAFYLLGILWFGVFFNWGDHTLFFQDWADITGPRTQFLRDAVKTGQLPLHISDPSTMHGNTVRYLTVPDTLISPQILLLARFSIQRFQFLNVLLFYTLGFGGLLVLAQKFRLSALTLGLLSLLFNFNGNILAHFTVGHMTWSGYFLFPWFALLIFSLLEGDHSWKWTFQMAALMFLIWLQGSFHQYLWLLIFLGLVGLLVRGHFWGMIRAGVFVLLLSAFRLFPAILLYGRYGASYITGFPTLYSLWDSLVNITNPLATYYYPKGYEGVAPWETASFIGILGTLFMLYFGLARGVLARQAPFQKLLLPLGGLLLLSMGQVFGYLRLLPIPLTQGERVGTRIISVVMAFLLIIAAERFQRWLDASANTNALPGGTIPAAVLLALGLEAAELWVNLTIWKIPNAVQVYWWVYYDSDKWSVRNNWSDTPYLYLTAGGLALTVLTALLLGVLSRREARPQSLLKY